MSEHSTSLAGFRGQVRLFPLPDLVLFPAVVQPLHIFEPRYRQLITDALADDRLITMALLRPGWEGHYDQRPPIHAGVCVGQIFKEEALSDGRFNLLLHGAARARVVEEVPADKLYRIARVELQQDQPVADERAARRLRRQLGGELERWFAAQNGALEQMRKLLESPLALGTLCDLFSFALPLEAAVKQELLEEIDVARRIEHLLARLAEREVSGTPDGRPFPPGFSAN